MSDQTFPGKMVLLIMVAREAEIRQLAPAECVVRILRAPEYVSHHADSFHFNILLVPSSRRVSVVSVWLKIEQHCDPFRSPNRNIRSMGVAGWEEYSPIQ